MTVDEAWGTGIDRATGRNVHEGEEWYNEYLAKIAQWANPAEEERLERELDEKERENNLQAVYETPELMAMLEAFGEDLYDDDTEDEEDQIVMTVLTDEEQFLAARENRAERPVIRLKGGIRPKGRNRTGMKRRGRSRRGYQGQSQAEPRGGGNSYIPRSMPLATTETVWLHYDDNSIARTNAGSLICNWRYRTSAFDPDPVLLSGALPGFTEKAAMYTAYRVVAMKWTITLISNELFPLVGYVVPLTADPGANVATGLSLAANAKGQIRGLSAIGGTGAHFSGFLKCANFYGIRGWDYDDDMNAPVTGNPLVMIYLVAGVNSPSILTAGGVVVTGRISFCVVFNRRKNLTN